VEAFYDTRRLRSHEIRRYDPRSSKRRRREINIQSSRIRVDTFIFLYDSEHVAILDPVLPTEILSEVVSFSIFDGLDIFK